MAADTFDIEKLLRNPYSRVKISGSGILVEAMYTNDFVVRSGNDFNAPLESGGAKANDSLGGITASGNILLNAVGLSGIDAVRLGNFQQTVKQWVGSQTPSFNLDLVFVAIRPGDDIVNKVHQLYSSTLPANQGTAITITPPLGYTAGGKGGVIQQGGLTISVGTWFRAVNQVMKSVNFSFSKECTPDGTPLYARGQIEFEHYRALTYTDFRKFFLSLPARAASGNSAPAKEETQLAPTQPTGTTVS